MERSEEKEEGFKKIIFALAFTLLGFIALQIPLSKIVGSNAQFSLYNFFAPIAAAFLGNVVGIISILSVRIVNMFIDGGDLIDPIALLRLVPVMAGALYFNKSDAKILVVPILAIIAFCLHPVGQTVWFCSLYWTIPIVCHFFSDRSLMARALGTTFTSHSVGGVIWLYTFPMSREAWIAVIPLTFVERVSFAAGIAVTYLAFKKCLELLEKKNLINTKLLLPNNS